MLVKKTNMLNLVWKRVYMTEIFVIIPIYRVEKYLAHCLDSVVAKTFKDYEVICVNDGSPDNCSQILDKYVKKDTRIKIFNQDNQGLSVARNNGLKNATGKYIYFLDSDDTIHPQLFEILHHFISDYSADLVCFDFLKNVDNTPPKISHLNIEDIKFQVTDNPLYLKNLHINACTKFFKRELLEGISFIPNIHFEDYPHTLAVWSKHPKTIVLSEKLYFYTIDENSITHAKAKPQDIKDYHIGLNFVYDTYNKPELKSDFQHICRTYIPIILKQQLGRCKRADKTIRRNMFKAFAVELRDLKQKGMLLRHYNKLMRYLKYLWIIRRY